MRLLIVCLETRKDKNTDKIYVDRAIRSFYRISNDIHIEYLYFKGKGNYKRAGLIRSIDDLCKSPYVTESTVLYCIDTDDLNNPDCVSENRKIKQFCKDKGYRFVFMCRDVEEVFLHRRVPDGEKVAQSQKFGKTEGLGQATEESLSASSEHAQRSNLLAVCDRFLPRKK